MVLRVAFPEARLAVIEAIEASGPSGLTYAGLVRASLENRLSAAPDRISSTVLGELRALRNQVRQLAHVIANKVQQIERQSRQIEEIQSIHLVGPVLKVLQKLVDTVDCMSYWLTKLLKQQQQVRLSNRKNLVPEEQPEEEETLETGRANMLF